jgi:hypothetical protein
MGMKGEDGEEMCMLLRSCEEGFSCGARGVDRLSSRLSVAVVSGCCAGPLGIGSRVSTYDAPVRSTHLSPRF